MHGAGQNEYVSIYIHIHITWTRSVEKKLRVNSTLTHKVYCVGVCYKQYKFGEYLWNSVTPILPPPPFPCPTESCLFTPYPNKASFRRYAFELSILRSNSVEPG